MPFQPRARAEEYPRESISYLALHTPIITSSVQRRRYTLRFCGVWKLNYGRETSRGLSRFCLYLLPSTLVVGRDATVAPTGEMHHTSTYHHLYVYSYMVLCTCRCLAGAVCLSRSKRHDPHPWKSPKQRFYTMCTCNDDPLALLYCNPVLGVYF